jgi:diguanylate cyclase (GGDEF)-like protein
MEASESPPAARTPHAYESELDALVTDEARRGTRLVLPFLLPTLYFVGLILGDAVHQPWVKTFMAGALASIILRWFVLVAMTRPWLLSKADDSTRARARIIAFTGCAWLTSAGFAAIYLAAAPALETSQITMLTSVAIVVCAVGMVSMTAVLWSYFGYIAIHLGAIVVLTAYHPEPRLGWRVPLMVVVVIIALAVIAARTNSTLREKIILGLKLQDASLRDALTGLRNRHFVSEFTGQLSAQLLGEWQAAVGRERISQRRSLGLFLVDIDHFKRVNDRYGHAAGDRVLMAFAAVAHSALRAQDIVARWGGEEFLVIAETRDRQAVLKIGERLRRAFDAHRTIEAGGVTLSATCSIGACLFPFDEGHPEDLTWEATLELADRALYEAKRTGRNRTLWSCPGSAGLLPRDALTATRDMDRAIRDHAIDVVGPEVGAD